jgi:hypothetical protein
MAVSIQFIRLDVKTDVDRDVAIEGTAIRVTDPAAIGTIVA